MMYYARFTEVEKITARGNRETIRCTDSDGSDVVLKRFLSPDAQDLVRLRKRGSSLGELSHSGLAVCLGAFEDSDSFALAYRWVPGETIGTRISNGERWSESELFGFIESCCDALMFAHGHAPPILHRDIKPDNVVWTGTNYVIIDFDAAREFIDSVGNVSVIGTMGYAAPEQFVGRATIQSDQYGIATTVVHMASHRHPTEFPLQKLRLDLSALELSDPLKKLLERMLEPHESERFSDLETLKAAAMRGSSLTPVEQALDRLGGLEGIVTQHQTSEMIQFQISNRFRPHVFFVLIAASAVVAAAVVAVISLGVGEFAIYGAIIAVFILLGAKNELARFQTANIKVLSDGHWSVTRKRFGFEKSVEGFGPIDATVNRDSSLDKLVSVFFATRSSMTFRYQAEELLLDAGFLPIETAALTNALHAAFVNEKSEEE